MRHKIHRFICAAQYPCAADPARFAQFSGYGDTPAVGVGKEQGRLGSFHLGDVEATGAVPEHVDPGVQP